MLTVKAKLKDPGREGWLAPARGQKSEIRSQRSDQKSEVRTPISKLVISERLISDL
jgi:hypothetical protein